MALLYSILVLIAAVAVAVPTKTQFVVRPHVAERAIRADGTELRAEHKQLWVDFCSEGVPAAERAAEYAARWGVENLGPVYEGACQYVFSQTWDQSGRMQARGATALGTELVPLVRLKRRVVERRLFGRGPQAVPSRTTYNITDPGIRAQWHHGGEGRFLRTAAHLNTPAAWAKGVTGAGVTVLVTDDGVQTSHEDFACGTIDPECSYSLIAGGTGADPSPDPGHLSNGSPVFAEDHGTACAGLVAACRDGVHGGVGVAYNARLCAVRILNGTGATTDLMEARALVIGAKAAVTSDSWGPDDGYPSFAGPHELRQRQMHNITHYGRNGLGAVMVVAGGNGACSPGSRSCAVREDSTFQGGFSDGYVNNPSTYSVGGVTDHDVPAYYSEACTCLAFAGPTSGGSEGLYTTDACDTGDCYMNDMGGTSGVAPLVAGQFALAVSARPSATRRELFHAAVHASQAALAERFFIAATQHTSYPSLGRRQSYFPWVLNGAGLVHSDLTGFGVIDSGRLVDNIRNASTYYWALPEEHTLRTSVPVAKPVVGVMATEVYTKNLAPSAAELAYIEYIQLEVSISFGESAMRCMRLAAITPDGTRSDFIPLNLPTEKASAMTMFGRLPLTHDQSQLHWSFLSRKPFLSKAVGTYTILVENRCDLDSFRVSGLTLSVSGFGNVPNHDPTKPLFPPYFMRRESS